MDALLICTTSKSILDIDLSYPETDERERNVYSSLSILVVTFLIDPFLLLLFILSFVPLNAGNLKEIRSPIPWSVWSTSANSPL